MWMRRGLWAGLAGTIIVLGVTLSFVRSAALMGVALAALWLARTGRLVTAGFLTAIVLVSGALLVGSEQAMQTRTVRGGDSVYITVNGRTEAWKVVFDDAWDLPLGKGVGEFGTAAERATFTISRSAEEARENDNVDIDSGYFATIADVGLVGLAPLLLLNARLAILGRRAAIRGSTAGWMVLSLLAVFLIDSITRESFSAFPTAFLGLLLIGIALAAAAEETARPPRSARAR
jgi:O-antigen ligase